MSTLHELFTDSIDGRTMRYAAESPEPPCATATRIGRVRRRRAVTAGTTSALAVSGVLVAGVARGGDWGPSAADQAADDAGSVAHVVVDLAAMDDHATAPQSNRAFTCGARITDLTEQADLEGFSIASEWHDGNVLNGTDRDPMVRTTVRYDGDPHAPVLFDAGLTLIVKDGQIVGSMSDESRDASMVRLDRGASWSTTAALHIGPANNVIPCALETEALPWPGTAMLPAGNYEVYAVATAWSTETEVARFALAERGLVLGPEDGATWTPGSIDCDSAMSNAASGLLVVQCDPSLAPDVTFDPEAQTATVPYESALYDGDVSVRLISEPLPLVIEEPPARVSGGPAIVGTVIGGEPGSTRPAADPRDLSCASGVFSWVTNTSQVDAIAPPFGSTQELVDASPIPVDIDPAARFDVGAIEVAPTGPAWLIAPAALGGYEVVGRADVTLSPSGPITINRAVGYPDVSIEVTDIDWCAEPADSVRMLVIPGQVTVTDGTTRAGTTVRAVTREDGLRIEFAYH